MKIKTFIIPLLTAVLLTACGTTDTDEGNVVKETDDIKALVHDYSVGNVTDQNASITSQHLIVTEKDGNETSYALPKDEFFVSISPYINQTHP